jgi:hypothetical protein
MSSDPPDNPADALATAAAAELAERLLDEISSAKRDWGAIAGWAEELGAMARAEAGRAHGKLL